MELVGHAVLKGNRVPQLLFATLFRSTGLFEVKLGAKVSAGVTVKTKVAYGCPAHTLWVGQFLYLSHKYLSLVGLSASEAEPASSASFPLRRSGHANTCLLVSQLLAAFSQPSEVVPLRHLLPLKLL